MALPNGVLIGRARHHPYLNPNLQITSFDASGFASSNIAQFQRCSWRCSDTDRAMSRLGIQDIGTMTVSATWEMGNTINGRQNLATRQYITATLTQRDDDISADLAALFLNNDEDFMPLLQDATNGVQGPFLGMPVCGVLRQIPLIVNGAATRQSFRLAESTLDAALGMIDRAMALGPTSVSPQGDLYGAWQAYVVNIRRPRMRAADRLLTQADQYVEQMAVDLITQGADMANMRSVLAVVYRRIFLLRLLIQAYLQGVWE